MDLSASRDTAESPFRREPDVGWGRHEEDAGESEEIDPETTAESQADGGPEHESPGSQPEATTEPAPEPTAVTWPSVTLVPPPEPALDEAHETTPTAETYDDEHRTDAPVEEGEELAVAVYVAFASTPRGYRLVVVDDGAMPDVGERIQLPELG
jgi:hypothetical protein